MGDVSEPNPADRLLEVLTLRARPDAGPDVFEGDSLPNPWGRVFGGQVLAQALLAAQRSLPGDGASVRDERVLHSMHGYFLRPGDPSMPITYAVERLRDGRSFSARRIQALQGGLPILSCIASFQAAADGVEHQVPMPDVPGPETLPSLTERYAGADPDAQWWVRRRPIDVRHLSEPLDLAPAQPRTAAQAVWLRTTGDLPDEPGLHAALLAYASDFTILEPVLRRHGVSWSRPGLRVASLDHAMWWHRPARADQWLLYVEESPSASGARGLSTGRMYTRDGQLICSVAQEGMVRVPPRQVDDAGASAPGLAARAGGE